MNHLWEFLLPPGWDASPLQAWATPSIKFADHTHLCAWVDRERHCDSKVSCPRKQCSLPGLEPELPFSETSAVTMRPLHLPHNALYLKCIAMFLRKCERTSQSCGNTDLELALALLLFFTFWLTIEINLYPENSKVRDRLTGTVSTWSRGLINGHALDKLASSEGYFDCLNWKFFQWRCSVQSNLLTCKNQLLVPLKMAVKL